MSRIEKKIIGVWSPKPGIGTSTVAVNLAVKSAKEELVTGLIELKRDYSDIPGILGLKIPETQSLVNAINTSKEEDIKTNFTRHSKYQNLFVMAQNEFNLIGELNELNQGSIERLIEYCSEKFQVLFLDLPSNYFEFTSYTAIRSYIEKLIIVIDEDLNCLKAEKQYRDFYKTVTTRQYLKGYVLNRYDGIIDMPTLENKLEINITASLPRSKRFIIQGNQGTPIIDIIPTNKEEMSIVQGFNKIFDFVSEKGGKKE